MGIKLSKFIVEGKKMLESGLLFFFLPVARFVNWVLSFAKGHLNHALAFAVVLYFLIAILNPFNVDENADAGLANTVNVVLSPFYGGFDRTGQRQITVILIQPESMSLFGNPFWPPSYEVQANIVERIAQFNPKAVFLDFYYSEPHRAAKTNEQFFEAALTNVDPPESGKLEKADPETLRIMNLQIGIPDAQSQANVQSFADRLSDIRLGKNLINRVPADERTDYPYLPILLGPIANDPAFNPLKKFDTDPQFPEDPAFPGHRASVGLTIAKAEAIRYPGSSDGGHRQAAFALFRFWCDRTTIDKETGKNIARKPCRNINEWIGEDRTLSVEWGFGARNTLYKMDLKKMADAGMKRGDRRNEWYEKGLSAGCTGSGFPTRLSQFLRLMAIGFYQGLAAKEPYRQRGCAYHDFIPAQDLFAGLSDDQLRAILTDRMVLVGADFRGYADAFDTPIYKRIPGVMIHAMALDNLIEHGKRAQRYPPNVVGAADLADIVTGISLAIALFLIVAIHSDASESENHARREKRLTLYIAVIFSITALGVLFSITLLHWPPFNILEFVLILSGSVVLLEIVVPPKGEKAPEPTMEKPK